MVPIRIDPFEPTAAELAGDEPPSETDRHTERQARTRLCASRATTPKGTHSKPNIHHESLIDTMTQTTKPQEDTSGDVPQAAQGKLPLGFDRSQHFLLVFSQRAINKIFIRIDTSKANFEGEHSQQHQNTPPNNWVPPQPLPAHPPKRATTPDAPVNLKYSTQGRRTLSKGNNTTHLHTTTHPPPNLKGRVLFTSRAPSPPSPAGPPRGGLTPDAPVNLKNSTLTHDHLGGWTFTTGNKATPLPTSTHPLLNPEGGMLPTNWAPPLPPPADPPNSWPTPDPPVNQKRPTLAYDHIGRWTLTTGMSITPLLTKFHSSLSPKRDLPPTAPWNPRPICIAVYSNAAQAGLEPVNPMCISAPPTGPLHYAVTEQYAKDYMMLYPQGIDVPSEKDSEPPIHFDVTARHASKPNPP
eukprot:scaffold1317_cov149-Isochrysis_galbana.AAC.2